MAGFHKCLGVDGKMGVRWDEHPDVLVGLDGTWLQVDKVVVLLGTAGCAPYELPMDVRKILYEYAQRTIQAYGAEMRAAEAARRRAQAARITSVARSLIKIPTTRAEEVDEG